MIGVDEDGNMFKGVSTWQVDKYSTWQVDKYCAHGEEKDSHEVQSGRIPAFLEILIREFIIEPNSL